MSTVVSTDPLNRPDLNQLIERNVARWLTHDVSSNLKPVVWEVGVDERGREQLTLRVEDWNGAQGSAVFMPAEFERSNENGLRARLQEFGEAIKRVARWRRWVKELYANVREYAADSLPGVAFEDERCQLHEEKSGKYDMTRLILRRGNSTMVFEPVGAWIVNADGRVDVKGIGGPFTLLFVENWNFWSVCGPLFSRGSTPLNPDSFREMAEECLDG